jgi:hypothetical protein
VVGRDWTGTARVITRPTAPGTFELEARMTVNVAFPFAIALVAALPVIPFTFVGDERGMIAVFAAIVWFTFGSTFWGVLVLLSRRAHGVIGVDQRRRIITRLRGFTNTTWERIEVPPDAVVAQETYRVPVRDQDPSPAEDRERIAVQAGRTLTEDEWESHRQRLVHSLWREAPPPPDGFTIVALSLSAKTSAAITGELARLLETKVRMVRAKAPSEQS